MPREQRTRVSAVPQRRVTPAKETLAVVANAPRGGFTVDPAESSLSELAGALSSVEPGIQKMLGVEQDRQQSAQRERGVSTAFNMTLEQSAAALKDGSLLPDQSPFFKAGFSEQAGMTAAIARRQKMEEAYANGDFDWKNGNLDEFILTNAQEDQPVLGDSYAMRGYTSVMQKFVPELRNRHVQAQAQAKREEAERGLTTRMNVALAEFASHKDTTKLHAELESIRTDGRKVFGVRNQRLDEMQFAATHTYGIEKGDPLAFDVFALDHPDGQKGMTNSPAWQEKIAKARLEAVAARRKADAVNTEQAEFDARQWVHGQTSAGRELSANDVRHLLKGSGHAWGVLDSGVVDSLLETNKKEAKKERMRRLAGAAALSGNTNVLAAINTQDKGIAQEGFDKVSNEILEADPKNGFARVAEIGARAGMVNSLIKEQFALANPANPTSFADAAQKYNSLKLQNPIYANQHLSDDQSIAFDVYNGAVASGEKPEVALENARRIGDSKTQREVASILRSDWARTFAKDVDSELDVDSDMNQAYVRQRVLDMAQYRMALGQTSSEKAVEWATQRFKATHDLVAGNYLPNFGKPMSPYHRKAVKWYLGEEQKQQAAKGNTRATDGLYIDTDMQTSRTGNYYIGYKGDGGRLRKLPLAEIANAYKQHGFEFDAEYHRQLQEIEDDNY